MKLELGCGRNPTEGYVHHDRSKHADHVDVVHDLDVFPWPWPNESCDEVLGLDVFEHLQAMPAVWVRECHRILKLGGVLRLRVPVFGSLWHVIDPTHVRGYHPRSFEYFIYGTDLHTRYGAYYFDFVFASGAANIEARDPNNIVATLVK